MKNRFLLLDDQMERERLLKVMKMGKNENIFAPSLLRVAVKLLQAVKIILG